MAHEQVAKLEGMLRVKENAKEMYSLAETLFKSASMSLDKEAMMVSDYYRAFYYYYFKNNVSKAINYAKAALNAANELKNTKYITQSADLVGVLCLRKFEIFQALEPLLLAYNVSAKVQDKKGIAATTLHIGDLFFALKDYQKAFTYYVEARDMAMRNEFERDVLFENILFKHIVTSIMLNKIEILESTINIAIMNFDGIQQAPFIALKEIVSLLKRLQYIERSIVEDIYSIFIRIDDIDDANERARVALLLQGLVERTDDTDLIIDYTELLDTYKQEVKNITLKEEIESVKATLLGFDTDSEQALGYAMILATENSLMSEALDFAIKRILSLQVAESERDNEILKNKELEQISATDELTGLFNRRTGVQKIEEALQDSSRVSYAFIMLDIDNFKQINDNYGHGVGDQTLVFLSKTLRSIFETDSIVTRLGGDEFVVLLYNLPTEYDIRKSVGVYKVNLLINYLQNTPLDYLEGNTVSVSCGVVLEDGDFDSLYQKSDIALYSSKAAGKGKVTVYDKGADEEQEEATSKPEATAEKPAEDINVTGKLTLEDAQKAEEERKKEIARKAIEQKEREAKEREAARQKALEEARIAEEKRRAEEEANRKKTEEELEEEAETEVIGGADNNEATDDESKQEVDNELDQLLNSFTQAVEEAEASSEDEDEEEEAEAPVMHLDPKEILRRRREAILKAANMDMDDDDDDEDEDDDDEDEKPRKVDPKELLRQRREAIRAKAMAASKASNVDEDDINGEDDEPDDDEDE
ncbi:MAG: diguanylate cyclase [Acholeplasmatales bacterium]|nr:diguanylate cyclase [Acholeplasmatales bacterium]